MELNKTRSGVAQSAERVAVNHWVGGSNPSAGAKFPRYSIQLPKLICFSSSISIYLLLCILKGESNQNRTDPISFLWIMARRMNCSAGGPQGCGVFLIGTSALT